MKKLTEIMKSVLNESKYPQLRLPSTISDDDVDTTLDKLRELGISKKDLSNVPFNKEMRRASQLCYKYDELAQIPAAQNVIYHIIKYFSKIR